MILYTLQPTAVVDLMKKNGRFICDINKSEYANDEKFINAYNWLIEQMKTKIGCPKNSKYPIWAWYKLDASQENMIEKIKHFFGCSPISESSAIIELEIPDEDVVLTDYNLWHDVLNDRWINPGENEKQWDELYDWFHTLPYDVREELKLRSWQEVFDTNYYSSDWIVVGRDVQATFWELRYEYVKNITYLNP